MEDSEHSSLRNEDLCTSLSEKCQIIEGPGSLTRYKLELQNLIKEETHLRRMITGEKDTNKPHKTILMVGETGTGKSTIINSMVSYMLGVKVNDRTWYEIIETEENQTSSQTKCVTVYDVYIKKSSFSLTVIDTPGFGSTDGFEKDAEIAESLQELFRSRDGVQEIDLVCLVVSAANARLTQTQLYVFDAIFSLFGKDVENNVVVLITRAATKPINAIKAIKESGVNCAKTDDGEPVYFRFDNSHCEALFEEHDSEEQYISEHKAAWDVLEENMGKLFDFLKKVQPVSMKLSECVLRKRKQLHACVGNLNDKIKEMEKKIEELEQTKEALESHKLEKHEFEHEVDEVYKEKVPVESKWWHLSKQATCCSVCEENCHYPGCWWVRDLSWCSVMEDGKCTVCTGKCDYTQHVKERKMYVVKTRKMKRTYEELKRKYKTKSRDIKDLINRIKEEINEIKTEKTRLVELCYQCVVNLEEIALKTDSVFTLQHLDFLTEKLNDIGKTERANEIKQLKINVETLNKSNLKYFYLIYNNYSKNK